MRKFHSPVNLKPAADASLQIITVDITLAELIQAQGI